MGKKRAMKKAASAADWNPMNSLASWGIRSSHAYALGLIILGLSVITTLFKKKDSRRARLGAILAPTLFTIGLGLKDEE